MNWLVAFGAALFSSSTLAGASILASSGFAGARAGSGGSVSSGRDSTRPRMRASPTCAVALRSGSTIATGGAASGALGAASGGLTRSC